MKLEFLIGSIVSINGKDMNSRRWLIRKDTLRFYGFVEDPSNFDTPDAVNIKAHESYVTFVASGEYKWYNRKHSNVLQSNYDHKLLTLSANPPSNAVNRK